LSITAGIAGRLSSVSLPCPWTGAEKVDGRPVGAVDGAVVGAAVMVEIVEALTDDAPKLRSTANNVEDETLTPKRGDEDPPTLTPSKGAVPDVVAAALLALEETTALLAFEVMTELAALLAFETMAELLVFETTAALLVFEVTTAAALLDLTAAAALLVLTTLLIFAVVVTARASTCSRIGAAATKALKNVIVARSFIVTDVLDGANMKE
jgi:hypothetical protein